MAGKGTMKVAFIGLGFMGAQQAKCLAGAGFDLAVFDTSSTATAPFKLTARIAASVAEVASGADVLCLCVRDDVQVNDVLLGDAGALAALDPGACVLIHSTVRPDTVKALSDYAAGRGIAVIDAPVSRTEEAQDDRFVVTMIGGKKDTLERVRPVLEAFSTRIVHVGPVGSAQALKISNNMVTWVQIVIARQAYQLATRAGVPEELLEQVMRDNGNLTPTVEKLSRTLRTYPPGASDQVDSMMRNQAGIGEKDLALAIEFAAACGQDEGVARSAQRAVIAALTGDPAGV